MDIISQMYAARRKRLRQEKERKSPRWQLAAAAVIDRLPLTGKPKEFAPQTSLPAFRVVAVHRYTKERRLSTLVMMNKHILDNIVKRLNAKEDAKQFPRWRFIVTNE